MLNSSNDYGTQKIGMNINAFAIIILAALVLEFSLKLVGDLLNLKSSMRELPEVLRGIYKPEEYTKSQEYMRITTRFGFVESCFTLLILLVFWFAGGFSWFDRIVTGWDLFPVITGLLYIGILLFAYSLIQLPFSI